MGSAFSSALSGERVITIPGYRYPDLESKNLKKIYMNTKEGDNTTGIVIKTRKKTAKQQDTESETEPEYELETDVSSIASAETYNRKKKREKRNRHITGQPLNSHRAGHIVYSSTPRPSEGECTNHDVKEAWERYELSLASEVDKVWDSYEKKLEDDLKAAYKAYDKFLKERKKKSLGENRAIAIHEYGRHADHFVDNISTHNEYRVNNDGEPNDEYVDEPNDGYVDEPSAERTIGLIDQETERIEQEAERIEQAERKAERRAARIARRENRTPAETAERNAKRENRTDDRKVRRIDKRNERNNPTPSPAPARTPTPARTPAPSPAPVRTPAPTTSPVPVPGTIRSPIFTRYANRSVAPADSRAPARAANRNVAPANRNSVLAVSNNAPANRNAAPANRNVAPANRNSANTVARSVESIGENRFRARPNSRYQYETTSGEKSGYRTEPKVTPYEAESESESDLVFRLASDDEDNNAQTTFAGNVFREVDNRNRASGRNQRPLAESDEGKIKVFKKCSKYSKDRERISRLRTVTNTTSQILRDMEPSTTQGQNSTTRNPVKSSMSYRRAPDIDTY
ncbi:uncharacterized protein [Haliotis cracherodii]|uniref:uncharacterized protein n=1 Tax=Haliotis cracherodii TaxID=6455 RepID=UPI0039EBAE54